MPEQESVDQLRLQITDLKARNRDLEAALGQHNPQLALRFRLPPTLSKLLGLLLALPVVSSELIRQRIELMKSDPKIAIHRLRKSLAPHGIKIASQRNYGWRIEEADKDRIKGMLEVTTEVTSHPQAA